MTILAQEENVGLFDNKILDQFEIPIGGWVDQMVDWIDLNMGWLLDIIRWPFAFLLDNVVDNFIASISWVWVCLAFFVIGSLVRNVKIGAFAAVALAMCGLLGTNYWEETARTIGMILVAVMLCALVGIPLGVLCGRFDGVWQVVRPTLDAMQVVHAFVYMLPIIFFFSFGVVPGTMVTMIFALPPLIRLTNLGIRQVPEDVVEASRAYGAPELRVLMDVQLPLARPAIMTGLNQTLLLAISMIGIAAIMGAGGLGLLVFRAVSNLDIALAASAGLALFLVAVVLDRISQPEADDGLNMFTRIKMAWAHRKDPEVLLATAEANKAAADAEEEKKKESGAYASVRPQEQQIMFAAAGAAVIAALSTFLTWGSNAGHASSYARRDDEVLDTLQGVGSDGLAASGGSWFGVFVLVGALMVLASVGYSMYKPGEGPRWFSPDGAMMSAGLAFGGAIGFHWMQVKPTVAAAAEASNGELSGFSTGIGAYLGLIAALGMLVACALWVRIAPFSPLRPMKPVIGYGRLFGGVVAFLLVVIALFSGWSFDRRADTVLTPELQAELDEVRRQVDEGELAAAIGAQNIQNIQNRAQASELIIIDGISEDGSRLGWLSLALSAVGLGLLLPAAGVMGINDRKQWGWSTFSAAAGWAAMAVAGGWVISILRVADAKFVSGAGSFLVLVAGFFLFASNRGVLNEFRRKKVYADDPGDDILIDATDAALAASGNENPATLGDEMVVTQ